MKDLTLGGYMSVFRYRVSTFRAGFVIERKKWYWPLWFSGERSGKFYRYDTYESAQNEMFKIIENTIAVENTIKQNKERTRLEKKGITAEEYLYNYPEKRL